MRMETCRPRVDSPTFGVQTKTCVQSMCFSFFSYVIISSIGITVLLPFEKHEWNVLMVEQNGMNAGYVIP